MEEGDGDGKVGSPGVMGKSLEQQDEAMTLN